MIASLMINVKDLFESLMFEERSIHLEEQEDIENGFYLKNILINYGEIECLRVPLIRRIEKDPFRPDIFSENLF